MSPPKSCEINGPRPSPLLIHKDSRFIRKPQLRQPVIIYTHSPKIIHTQPKDFMALVQRLTGFNPPPPPPPSNALSLSFSERNFNDNDSSSGLTTEEEINECGDQKQSVVLKQLVQRQSNSSLLRYSSDVTTPFSSPALINSLSPSFMEFLKALPEF
ncbi:VQ motif-containing protein 8, chloroplastic [Benincasa hispida]|uniref:VQ motif-containing protein 8, chloroplastic n=1 Tax=Benincasa hispida TaxID=102211 RepID=UPI00190028A3|nr:VQ motif-containing protein 8, chloroplastic [Benincasa hispida]